jgi:hypothetical protein
VQDGARTDGADLRVVHWDGSAWQELDRVLADGSSWNATATQIFFRLEAPILGGASDSDYFLYWDNPAGTSPPRAGLANARYYLVEELGVSVNTGGTYQTKATLQFTPGRSDELWVVVATWLQGEDLADNTRDERGDSRLLVNDVELVGSHELTHVLWSAHDKGLAQVFTLTGMTASQKIDLQFRERSGEDGRVSSARLLAFRVPDGANADAVVDEARAKAIDLDDPTEAHALAFTPQSAGDYLWLVSGAHREGPSNNAVGIEVRDETDAIVQRNRDRSICCDSTDYYAFVHFGVRSFDASQQRLTIVHRASQTLRVEGPGSERMGLFQAVFRADAFASVQHAAATARVDVVAGDGTVTQSALSTTTTTAPRDHVYLAVSNVDRVGGNADATIARVTLDGANQIEEDIAHDHGASGANTLWTVFAWATAETSTGGRDLAIELEARGTQQTTGRWAHLISLRYKDPLVSVGAHEDR